MFDCHVHSKISHDGVSTYAEYMKAAKELGLSHICFTEHIDYYDGLKSKLHTLDADEYEKAYFNAKDDGYQKTYFGAEIGLQPDLLYKGEKTVAEHDFDFVIGSMHITKKYDIAVEGGFFEKRTIREGTEAYFGEILECIEKTDCFDVFGHLDYIVRYGDYANKMIDCKEYSDIIDAVLSALIKKDKGIEVNTSGLRYGLGYPHPNPDIVKRFFELGGRIITVGSDAHKAKDLCFGFDIAKEVIRNAGFEKIAYFEKRTPKFVKI